MANGINLVQEDGVYAKLNDLPRFQYRILEYLFKNEDIWKLLFYPFPDALYRDNLKNSQKSAIIYAPINNQYPQNTTNYRVFLTELSDDMWPDQASILRVSLPVLYPINRTEGDIVFAVDVLSHVKIDPLEEFMSRKVCLLANVIGSLNGAEIDGVGKLAFSRQSNSSDKATLSLSNGKTYTGYQILFSTHYVA